MKTLMMELHDSTIDKVIMNGQNLLLELSAVICVLVDGELDENQDLRIPAKLEIGRAKLSSPLHAGMIWDGSAQVDEQVYELIPLTLEKVGKCKLHLSTEGGDCEVTGASIKLHVDRAQVPVQFRNLI